MPDSLLPIEVDALRLVKGERAVLNDLSLTLESPGITVVMGPNGAGKSLLLRSIHGLIEPEGGKITLGGLTVEQSRPYQSMVFQHPVLLRRTALQNLAFAVPEIAEQAPDKLYAALASVNLTERAEQPARMMSGGEQQRLALARALLMRPKLLLLDEATASLDPASIQMIETLVKRESEHGTKVILISHDLGQARRLADEIVFVFKGEVVEHCAAHQFFERPEHPAAQAYLAGEIYL